VSGFLLDTCLISELMRPRADAGVIEWLATNDERGMYLSEVTLGELTKGLHKLPPGSRRDRLERFFTDEVVDRFEGRWLAVDTRAWTRWGELLGAAERRGRPGSVMDALQAALALVHGLEVVTRNVRDFTSFEVRLVNPWST